MPALVASLRLANAPSVVSNVLVGFALGLSFWGANDTPARLSLSLLMLCGIGLCLLFAGNLANDWRDRDWDKIHRPERALPSGKFPPALYLCLLTALSILALVLSCLLSPPVLGVTLSILVLIAVYTWSHKRHFISVLPMAGCRAGLYLLGFVMLWPLAAPAQSALFLEPSRKGVAFIAAHGLGLFTYIVGLSLNARFESRKCPPLLPLLLGRCFLFFPLLAMAAWHFRWRPVIVLCAMLPLLGWLALSLTLFRRPLPAFVSALLAGIPLVDFIAAAPLAFQLAHWSLPFAFTILLTPPIAFALGRYLQSCAPAT